jgi:hypothetical protein
MPRGVTNYTVDIDGKRIPTIVPGNERLRADVVSGSNRKITEQEIQRALVHAMKYPNETKSSSVPVSPLGSEFDLPQRITSQPSLFYSTGKILGGNWFDNQIAYPERRQVTLGEK